MSALLPEYEGRIDLIYADPPFFTNRKYSARIGRGEDSRKPEEWALAEGYPDHWLDLDTYLDFLYQRLELMYRLLSPNGTLYLHLDWHVNSYARLFCSMKSSATIISSMKSFGLITGHLLFGAHSIASTIRFWLM